MVTRNLLLAGSLTIIAGSASLALADIDKMDPRSREHFPLADANDDGGLSLEEFKNFVYLEAEDGVGKSKNIKRFGMYERAFSRLDANDDGAVTLLEIAELQAQRRQ